MASVIKSIAFKNFYNFYGEFENNTFNFKEGLNIVNADNGMGKSKLYNGFLWIIKDVVYDSDSRSLDTVNNAAIKIASERAKSQESVVDFGVKLVFEDEQSEYTITKTIKLTKDYASNGWLTSNPKTEVLEVDGITHNSKFVYDLQQQENIIKQRLLSPSMQPYSLLQGEAIDDIVDLSNSNNLASTVEALTDIAELKVIEKSCETLYKNADKDLANKQKACAQNKNDFENVQKEKAEILQQIENANESIAKYKEQLKKASDEASKHEASLANTERRVEYREKLIHLRDELSAKEAALNDLLLSINDNLFKKPLPWLLYGTDGFVDKFLSKRTEYTEEMVAKNMAKNPQLLASILPEGSPDDASLTKMLEECRCFVCNRTFEKGDEHYKHVEMLRNRSLQKPTSSKAKFQSFFDGIQKSVAQFMKVDSILGAMAGTFQSKNQLEDTIKALKGQIQNTLTEYKNYGGVDDGISSQGDKNILSSYNQAKDDIQKYTQLLDSANKHVEKLRDRLQSCDKKLSEYAGTAVPQACQDLKEIIEDAQGIFSRTKQRIYDEVIQTLEKKANDFYQELTQDNNVDGGTLVFKKTSYDSIELKVFNEAGGELSGASEGFQRMKKIAVLMAIISSKFGGGRFDYPFIADAPFSAFGKNFINNFFETVPSVFRQCIIMIKDLYDVNSPELISEDGKKLLNRMKDGNPPGTFYVISIPELSDPVRMTTNIHAYLK